MLFRSSLIYINDHMILPPRKYCQQGGSPRSGGRSFLYNGIVNEAKKVEGSIDPSYKITFSNMLSKKKSPLTLTLGFSSQEVKIVKGLVDTSSNMIFRSSLIWIKDHLTRTLGKYSQQGGSPKRCG